MHTCCTFTLSGLRQRCRHLLSYEPRYIGGSHGGSTFFLRFVQNKFINRHVCAAGPLQHRACCMAKSISRWCLDHVTRFYRLSYNPPHPPPHPIPMRKLRPFSHSLTPPPSHDTTRPYPSRHSRCRRRQHSHSPVVSLTAITPYLDINTGKPHKAPLAVPPSSTFAQSPCISHSYHTVAGR